MIMNSRVVGCMKKISVVTIIGILFLFTLASVGNLASAQAVDNNFTVALLPDIPIDIVCNEDFEYFGFPGEGTVEEPYIIEGRSFEIEEGSFSAGIKIKDTTDHFVIQNCNFTAAVIKTVEPTYSDFGIHLKNVTNAVVKNCLFSELMYGVFLLKSGFILIEQNNFTGMNIDWFEYEHMGRGVGTGTLDDPNMRIVIRNNYMENCSNGILLMEAEEFDVYGNMIVTCGTGIHAENEVTNGIIRENTILNGTRAGIQSVRLDGITIQNNTCMYNQLYGIWMGEDAIDNIVTLNVLKQNGDFTVEIGSGIIVDTLSSGNNITMNDFISNYENVINNNYGAFYDLNYYSDYEGTDDDGDGIGEDPHLIDSGADTSDLHPRVLTLSEWFELYPPVTTTVTNTTSNSTTTPTIPFVGFPQEMILLISGSAVVVIVIIFVVVLKKKP